MPRVMKQVSIIRAIILLALFSVGLLSLFAIPMDDSPTWTSDLFFSKGLAFFSLWLFNRLYERWKVVDRVIRAFDRWSNKGMDKPNPMYIGKIKEQT